MFRPMLSLTLILLLTQDVLAAGKYNAKLGPGDAAPAWEKLPGVDDKEHSLADLKEKEIVVVVFTCNTCPYAVDYQERLKAFATEFCGADQKVALVAINVNKVADDLLPAMKERAEQQKFNFPYLYDETQQIAKMYGAVWTPECFVLNKERKIVYQGAIDDNSNLAKVKEHYLIDAVEATLAGEKITVAETPGVGCAVRFVRERKKKQ